MLLKEETETVGEPTLQEYTEVASTEASDYQPNNPLFQTEQTNIEATEINPVSAEVPQPKSSSTPHTRANKRKRPLDEVDKTFVNFLKERQRQDGEAENKQICFF
ncbi:hypothetical protein JTB14_012521 [Gonioctena quinquepunctata]|nr:hypothetical protein JTB14_012521 [Gonioctena quinquepunctata]